MQLQSEKEDDPETVTWLAIGSYRLEMSLQRQHFLLSYLKTLSVGPAGTWTSSLPLGRPALIQLSLPGSGSITLVPFSNFFTYLLVLLDTRKCGECQNVETDNIFVQHSDLLINLLIMSNFSKLSVHTLFLLMKLGTHGSGPHPHQRYY